MSSDPTTAVPECEGRRVACSSSGGVDPESAGLPAQTEGIGATAPQSDNIAAGTFGQDISVGHEKVVSPSSELLASWCGKMQSIQALKLVCLPRFIIVAVVVRRLLRGPVRLYFITPLWCFVYCIVNLFFFGATTSSESEVSGDIGCGRSPACLSSSSCARSLIAYSRCSVVALLVWNFIDTILTLIMLVFGVGAALYLFTDVDGVVEGCWKTDYASSIASTIFCGVAILCDVASFFVGIRYCILWGRAKAAPPSVGAEAAEPRRLGEGACQPSDMVQNKDPINGCRRVVRDRSCRHRTVFGVLIAALLVSVIYLSMCLHDELRSRYYENASTASYADCDPLVPRSCMMPFPSSYWLRTDPSTPTGYKVNIGRSTLPFIKKGIHGNPDALNRYDGFSVSAPILWYLDGIIESQLVSPTDVKRSLLLSSSTLIINSRTGATHPHFSELDYLDPQKDRIAYSLPAVALEFNTTYLVVIQGLSDSFGNPLRDSDVWSSYRNLYESKSFVLPTTDPRFDHYAVDVFPLLEVLGLNLSRIHLSWDFHTTSFESMSELVEKAVQISDKKMESVLQNGDLDYEIIRNDVHTCKGINASMSSAMASTMHVRVNVPWILDGYARIGVSLNKKLMYAKNDDIMLDEIPVGGRVGLLLQVPCSVVAGLKNVSSIIEFGHGLFGSRIISTDDWLRESSNRHGWILWSSDWRGITLMDSWGLGRLVGDDNSDFDPMEANLLQSFASKTAIRLLLPQLLSEVSCKLQLCSSLTNFETLAETSGYLRSQSRQSNSRNMAIDFDVFESLPTGYIGHSMGAIIGAAWSAVAGYSRSVGLAGGSPFTFILGRSDAFFLAKLALDAQYYSRTDARVGLSLWQSVLDVFESSGWVRTERISNVKYLQVSVLGDSTVSHIASNILAANVNSSILAPSPDPSPPLLRSTYGDAPEDSLSIAFQEKFDGDFKKISPKSKTSEHTAVHNCLLVRAEIVQLHNQFLAYGSVAPPCGGAACEFAGHMKCSMYN